MNPVFIVLLFTTAVFAMDVAAMTSLLNDILQGTGHVKNGESFLVVYLAHLAAFAASLYATIKTIKMGRIA